MLLERIESFTLQHSIKITSSPQQILWRMKNLKCVDFAGCTRLVQALQRPTENQEGSGFFLFVIC